MTIEKLPSGSFRVTIMEKGKRYRKTFDHKPSQKEVLSVFSIEISMDKAKEGSFETHCEKYCKSKSATLSPKTVREYELMYKRFPDWLLNMDISEIEQVHLNQFVNELSKNKLSAKSIKNAHGFVSSVLRTFRPSMVISTTLPKKRKEEPYIPSTEDVQKILKHFESTEYEIPLILATYGMRKSEIIALELSDLNSETDTIRINKAKVINSKGEFIVKETKTVASTREIVIPHSITEKIIAKGYIYKGYPDNITRNLKKAQEELGIEHFSLHKMRHYFASKMHSLGISEADILSMGGWESDEVMKKVYRHSMIEKEKDAKKIAAEKLASEIFRG